MYSKEALRDKELVVYNDYGASGVWLDGKSLALELLPISEQLASRIKAWQYEFDIHALMGDSGNATKWWDNLAIEEEKIAIQLQIELPFMSIVVFCFNERMLLPHWLSHLRNPRRKQYYQIEICEGKQSGGYFFIYPAIQSRKYDTVFSLSSYPKNLISLDEDFAFPYIYFFLQKYFDESLNKEVHACYNKCIRHCGDIHYCEYGSFNWWDSNYFTVDSIRQLLTEIRHITNLLEQDFDNNKLTELKCFLKDKYSICTSLGDYPRFTIGIEHDMTESEKEQFIVKHIEFLIDFYRKFCQRMEQMLDNAIGYNLICFEGP